MSAESKALRQRQRDRQPAVSERIAADKPPPIMTIGELRDLVPLLVKAGLVLIQFHVRRSRRPDHTGLIMLPLVGDDGRRRYGPTSAPDRPIERCGSQHYTAWWLVQDLVVWLAKEAP